MVAIVLGAGILMGGRLLLEQITLSGQTLAERQTNTEDEIHREQTLRDLFRNVEVGTSDSLTFGGADHTMAFTTWCDSANGLRGQCRVTLTLDSLVTATSNTGLLDVLVRDSTIGAFRYLNDARNGGQWFRNWGRGITVPLAVGIVFGRDTTVLRIGSRG
jgi:hypothetical protein